uniref:Uncharacterized protein n=1 Tax=viral metagenome TaxID=1070528 RepID=A0A6M3L3I8_9ZZZZ
MAVPCNTGFSEAAKLLVGEAADKFQYVAVGKGTAQAAANTTLNSECTESGLTRVAADSAITKQTTVANDTVQFIKTFTAGANATVTEAGAFNNATINAGDMLMVGDLSPTAPMVTADTLKVTLECQIKAA